MVGRKKPTWVGNLTRSSYVGLSSRTKFVNERSEWTNVVSEKVENMQGKFFTPTYRDQGGFKMCVCVSVCLSVCLSSRKCDITFQGMGRFSRKFKGQSNSVQVIFGWVTRTGRTSGSGRGPETGHFCQLYLLPGFWSYRVMSYLFGNGSMGQTKNRERIFDFCLGARENGIQIWEKRNWRRGTTFFWEFGFFA